MLMNGKSEYTQWRFKAKKTGLGTKAIRLVVPGLAVAGWLAMCLPSKAVTPGSYYDDYTVTKSYYNDYRVCAAKLLNVGVAAPASAQACADAVRPRELAACVYNIQKQTQIPSTDAISPCRQARRPRELASCVVGIAKNSKEAVNPVILNYCSRSLLPVNFAQCVVGLRAEIDFAASQALETCIDASDRVSGVLPSFIPATTQGVEFRPSLNSTPSPAVQPPITSPQTTPTPVIPSTVAPSPVIPPAPTR